jgi:hypothetical protein
MHQRHTAQATMKDHCRKSLAVVEPVVWHKMRRLSLPQNSLGEYSWSRYLIPYTLTLTLKCSGPTDTGGFVAIDYTNHLIVASFRGSQSAINFFNNLEIVPMLPTSLCHGCITAPVFINGYNAVKDKVIGAVQQAARENPGYQIIATGHSYGAALAHFAALDLRNRGFTVDLVSITSTLIL